MDSSNQNLLQSDLEIKKLGNSAVDPPARKTLSIKALFVLAVVLIANVFLVFHIVNSFKAYAKKSEPQPPAEEVELEKRLWWWLAGTLYSIANAVFAWQGLVDSCQHFTESTWNGAQCVWGAISTVVAFGSSANTIHKSVGHLAKWQQNNGIQIIPLGNLGSAAVVVASYLTNTTALTVTHTVTQWKPNLYMNISGHVTHTDDMDHADVFNVHHPLHGKHHISMFRSPVKGITKFRLGHGHVYDGTGLQKRGDYNEQAFSKGGIDFDMDENEENGEAYLDQQNDYNDMFEEVQCFLGGHEGDNSCFGFQVYDDNHQGTMAAGAVVPYGSTDDVDKETKCYNNFKGSIPLTDQKCKR